MQIGFRVIENRTKKPIGFLKDALMNLTTDTDSIYYESVTTKTQLIERTRFYNRNLQNIIGQRLANKNLFTITENIRIRNYSNYSENDLIVIPCYSSETNKI